MDDFDGRRWIWLAVALGLAAVVCVCVSAAGLAVYQTGGLARLGTARLTPTPPPARPPAQPTPTPFTERLQLVGTPLLARSSGGVQVSGLIRNPEPVARSAVLTATLYDAGGRVVGAAVGAVLNVQPNDTKPYTLYSEAAPAEVARAHVVVASRLPASARAGETSITFENATARAVGTGFQVEARATNTDRVPHRFTAVASLLDGAGNLVGIARGAAALPAGGSATVTLTSTERLPAYQTIRVQVDVLDE